MWGGLHYNVQNMIMTPEKRYAEAKEGRSARGNRFRFAPHSTRVVNENSFLLGARKHTHTHETVYGARLVSHRARCTFVTVRCADWQLDKFDKMSPVCARNELHPSRDRVVVAEKG